MFDDFNNIEKNKENKFENLEENNIKNHNSKFYKNNEEINEIKKNSYISKTSQKSDNNIQDNNYDNICNDKNLDLNRLNLDENENNKNNSSFSNSNNNFRKIPKKSKDKINYSDEEKEVNNDISNQNIDDINLNKEILYNLDYKEFEKEIQPESEENINIHDNDDEEERIKPKDLSVIKVIMSDRNINEFNNFNNNQNFNKKEEKNKFNLDYDIVGCDIGNDLKSVEYKNIELDNKDIKYQPEEDSNDLGKYKNKVIEFGNYHNEEDQ